MLDEPVSIAPIPVILPESNASSNNVTTTGAYTSRDHYLQLLHTASVESTGKSAVALPVELIVM